MRLVKIQLVKLTVFILAFQILNVSIDSANASGDQYYYKVPDNFNYIDSYTEYIAEVILQYENAIPETAKKPLKQMQQRGLSIITCEDILIRYSYGLYFSTLKNIFVDQHDHYIYQFIKEICPPPKSGC